MTDETTENNEATDSPVHQQSRPIWKYLTNENPFYLLSFACLLHGTALSMSDSASVELPWPRMGMTCGYLLACACIAWYVVRRLSLWNDARTLLVIISLLFLELALTFDQPLVENFHQGTILLIVGYVFCALLFEVIVRTLKMRFPAVFRIPSHLLLALLFLYPIFLHPEVTGGLETLTRWRIYAFPWAAGLLMLTLLPAMRRGREATANSGTPWIYPLYPWSWFVVLFLGIGIRSFTQTLSFDTVLSLSKTDALALPSIFGGYFLTPLLLALAVLFAFSLSRNVRRLGMALPYLAMLLSVQWSSGSLPYREFLQTFETTLESPFLIAAIFSSLYFAVRFFREKRFYALNLTSCLILLSLHRPLGAMVGEPVVWQIEPLAIGVAALLQLALGISRNCSTQVIFGSSLVCVGLRWGIWQEWTSVWPDLMLLHAFVFVIIVAAAVYQDWMARMVRKLLPFLLAGLVAACYLKIDRLVENPAQAQIILSGYSIFMAVIAAIYGGMTRDRLWIASCGISLGIGNYEAATDLYNRIRELPGWSGVGSFAIAFLLLLAGLGSSFSRGRNKERTRRISD